MTKLVPMEEIEFEHEEETFTLSKEASKAFRLEVEKQKIEQAIEIFAMSCGNLEDPDMDQRLREIEDNIELLEEDE
jgi:hypothetical protein